MFVMCLDYTLSYLFYLFYLCVSKLCACDYVMLAKYTFFFVCTTRLQILL